MLTKGRTIGPRDNQSSPGCAPVRFMPMRPGFVEAARLHLRALLSATACAMGGCVVVLRADDSWQLNTADTALVVALRQGVPVVTELRSTQGGTNWLHQPISELLMPSVVVQGLEISTKWKFEGGAFDPGSGQLVLRFSNAIPSVVLQSIWRARPGRGPVEHWLTLSNRSGNPITIGHQDSLVLNGLIVPADESLDAWSIRRGAGNATEEGGTMVRSVGRNSNESLISSPTDGSSPVPWLALQAGTSRGIYVGWEFSGVGRIHFQGAPDEGNAAASSGPAHLDLEVGNAPDFKTDVPAGDTFWVPPAFVGCYVGDIDDGRHGLHRFVMEKLLPKIGPGRVASIRSGGSWVGRHSRG